MLTELYVHKKIMIQKKSCFLTIKMREIFTVVYWPNKVKWVVSNLSELFALFDWVKCLLRVCRKTGKIELLIIIYDRLISHFV